jgi:hypothetical protein
MKWYTRVIVACTDTNVCPVQSHVCAELPRVAYPRHNPPGIVGIPLLPTPHISPMSSTHRTLLLFLYRRRQSLYHIMVSRKLHSSDDLGVLFSSHKDPSFFICIPLFLYHLPGHSPEILPSLGQEEFTNLSPLSYCTYCTSLAPYPTLRCLNLGQTALQYVHAHQ